MVSVSKLWRQAARLMDMSQRIDRWEWHLRYQQQQQQQQGSNLGSQVEEEQEEAQPTWLVNQVQSEL